MESLKCGVFKVFIQCSCCNQVCVNEWTLALGVPTCGSEPSAAVLGMAVLYWSADPMAHLKEAGFDSCALLCFLASMSLSPSHSQERRAAAFRPLREMAASALLLEKTGRSQLECGDIVMNVPGLAPQQSPPDSWWVSKGGQSYCCSEVFAPLLGRPFCALTPALPICL